MKLFSKMDKTMVDNLENTIPENTKKGIETMKSKVLGGNTVTDVIEKAKKNGAKATTPNVDKSVNTPKPVVETKPTETKKENTVVAKDAPTEKKEESKADTYADNLLKNYGVSDDAMKKAEDAYIDKHSGTVDNVAERNTKDNVKRLAKYLGGGIVGQIADTVGIYGDMMSTAKHNLAQAYFQAAGKGGQYKDPLAKEILSKKINTMIDSVASAIKENNTRQSESGFKLLNMTQDEAAKIYGRNATMIGKWLDTWNSKEEAALMADFAENLKNDPRMDNPNFANGLYAAMKDPNEKMVLVGAFKGDPELAENYIFANEQLAMANTTKGLAEAEIAQGTKDALIAMTNADNNFKKLYANLNSENARKKADLEMQQIINGARIVAANASDAEINNYILNKTKASKIFGAYEGNAIDLANTIKGFIK